MKTFTMPFALSYREKIILSVKHFVCALVFFVFI